MITNDEVLKKARKAHKDKYGDKLPEEMARRASLSHESQLLKYGGVEGYKKEMARRARKGHARRVNKT